jgi:DNA repair exonuclease SbcCD ATPase subunit
MIKLDKYTSYFNTQKAKLELLVENRVKLEESLMITDQLLKDLREAEDVMNVVSVLAQEDSKQVVEELVTLALQSVYGTAYAFEIENKINRGQPETFLYVVKEGEKCLLKNADDYFGGGVVDICSFSLRVVCWAISDEKSDNVLVLDEPLKNLDNGRCELAGEMIKELSESLDLQFIIITRLEPLEKAGDKVFFVKQTNEVSNVSEVNNV